jgi:hypothetical protein
VDTVEMLHPIAGFEKFHLYEYLLNERWAVHFLKYAKKSKLGVKKPL